MAGQSSTWRIEATMRAISLFLMLICLAATTVVQREPDMDGGRAELAELQGLLRQWTQRADWPQLKHREGVCPLSVSVAGDPTPEISSRLACFSTRFGVRPRECPGWEELSRVAAEVYTAAVAAHAKPDDWAVPGENWFEPGWVSARALLLDITGHGDEASTLLFGESPRIWAGCCPACLSESLFDIARARAEFLDRAGDAQGALLWLHEAWYENGADELAELFGRPRDVKGLLSGRYAVLLAESGDIEAAAGIVRWLESHAACALGSSIARATLGDHLPESPGSRATVFAVPLCDGSSGDYYGAGMAFIAGDPDVPDTWRLLACRLPKHPERSLGNRIAPDYSADLVVLMPDDPRVLPFVETCTRQPAAWRWAPALKVQRALGRPARERLSECLRATDIDDPITMVPSTAQRIDEVARLLCGGGPALPAQAQSMRIAEVRDAWIDWLGR
jgi:hypothetical protein